MQKDDVIYRQAAIDALDVLCQEHRYKIPGKGETYSQYNEAWQDALDRAEGAICNLPSAESDPSDVARAIATIIENEKDMRVIAQPEIVRCKDCKFWRTYVYVDGRPKFLPKCGFNQIYVNGEDFCSRAERRENDKR